MPVLGALLLADVIVHRDQPLLSLITTRGWWYLLIAGALLLVRSHREEWLTRVDRRFFRERYDAHRLLTSIAEQVGRASSFDVIAPSIARQIDEALHPTFVSVLTHRAASSSFSSDAARVPEESGTRRTPGFADRDQGALRPAKATGAVARRYRLGPSSTPIGRTDPAAGIRIELLVPIWGLSAAELPLGLIVLGPRRSEEPYGQEDLELLTTIAHAVGALLQRSSDGEQGLAECERCGRCYEGATAVCVQDRQRLTRTRGTILINGRYRLESRLGRGGMGTVYVAMDTALERPVAVKVIRDDVTSPLDLDSRFRREARAAASFAHPHVVRVYDFGVERSGRPFLVMELLEGGYASRTAGIRRANGSRRSASDPSRRLFGVGRGARPRARAPGSQAGEHLPAASRDRDRSEGTRLWSREGAPRRADCRRFNCARHERRHARRHARIHGAGAGGWR